MSMNETAHLTTGRQQRLKQHFVYDPGGRMTDVYEATADAKHGQGCLKTHYDYDGASNRVLFMIETNDVWDSSWG